MTLNVPPTPVERPLVDAVLRYRLRRRARREVARGLHSATRLSPSGSPVTSAGPTVEDIRLRAELEVGRHREAFFARAGDLVIDYRAHRTRRTVYESRIRDAARSEPDREIALALARRLQRRIGRTQLGAAELEPRLDREVDRLRVRAARSLVRADRQLAHFHGEVLVVHPQGSHLTLAPPQVARPAWLAARTLDELIDTLFPAPQEAPQ